MDTITSTTAEIEKFVTTTERCINTRFSDFSSNGVLKSFHIMEPRNWPTEKDQIIEYGQSEVNILTEHYRSLLLSKGTIDPQLISDEWSELLISALNQNGMKLNTLKGNKLWPQLLGLYKPTGEYINALALVEIWLVLAIASSEPERGFSLMNRIKSDWRSTLNNESLNDLMTIEMSEKNLCSFDPTRSVSLWWKDGNITTGRRLVACHGSHKMSTSNADISDSD